MHVSSNFTNRWMDFSILEAMNEDGDLSQQPFFLVLVKGLKTGAVETFVFACGPFSKVAPTSSQRVGEDSRRHIRSMSGIKIDTHRRKPLNLTAGWLQWAQSNTFARGPWPLHSRDVVQGGLSCSDCVSGSCQAHLHEERMKKRLRFVLLVTQCQASGDTWWKTVLYHCCFQKSTDSSCPCPV